jgi:hypothetical protein
MNKELRLLFRMFVCYAKKSYMATPAALFDFMNVAIYLLQSCCKLKDPYENRVQKIGVQFTLSFSTARLDG